MSLAAPVVRCLHAYDALSEICTPYPWGTVNRNPSLPHLHDANRAWVFDATTPALGQLREAMTSAQRAVPVAFTQVEVLDTESRPALMNELTAWLGPPPDAFVFMTTSTAPAPDVLALPPGMTVAEQPFPAGDRWLALIDAGHPDEDPLPPGVLREFATRDTSVLAPAGMRLFAAQRQGEVIAYASLLTLHGVGLIDNVATMPAQRGRGAATAVVGAAIAAGAAAGNDQTCLFTQEASDAQRIYERLGMRTIARAAQFRLDQPLPL
jgi:ribosomal protein S18 acetylase RimI-like enzyme